MVARQSVTLLSVFLLAISQIQAIPVDYEPKLSSELSELLSRAGPNAQNILTAWNAGTSDSELEALHFLISNMPTSDLQTLSVNYIVNNVALALAARNGSTWAQNVPWDIFLNNVVPYASLAEPRDDWRSLFFSSFMPLVKSASSLSEAVLRLNQESWKIVQPPIIFVAAPPDQLNNYSPFQTMKAHNASCTGLSIFLVDACRAVGIPARVAGVPHWNKPECSSDMDPECGNHDWVEVYTEEGWAFVDQDTNNALNTSWFYPNPTQFQVPHSVNHSIYAASWNRSAISTYFPMVWDWNNHGIPAFDVTCFYTGCPASNSSDSFLNSRWLSVGSLNNPLVPLG